MANDFAICTQKDILYIFNTVHVTYNLKIEQQSNTVDISPQIMSTKMCCIIFTPTRQYKIFGTVMLSQ